MDQKLEDGLTTVGTVARWNTNAFVPFSSLPATPSFTIDGDEILRADQSIISGQKYKRWNDDPNVVNHHRFDIDGNMNRFVSNFDLVCDATVGSALLETGTLSASIDFYDPWLIDFADSLYGFNLRNQGMSAPFKAVQSAQNNLSTNTAYKGVFLNQDYNIPGAPFYSLRAPSVQENMNGFTGYFQGWTASGAIVQNASSPDSQGVVFTAANATVTAQYKAHLGTGAPALTDAKNQRRLISNGNNSVMVYESAGDVWITLSSDNGTTWGAEERLNTIPGTASNPTLSNRVSTDRATIAWLENNGGVTDIHLQNVRLIGGSFGQVVYYGWGGDDFVRGPRNHTTLNTLPLGSGGQPFTWRGRLDARPVLSLSEDCSSILLAVERANSGIMAAEVLSLQQGFLSAYVRKEGGTAGGWPVSTNTGDICPVILSYPSAYGFPASTRIFYLAAGYASGKRIAQFDFTGGSTTLVPGPYGEYTYYSLQASTSRTSASFVLAADAYIVSGYSSYRSACLFQKPTYYGNGAPSLSTSYTYGYLPTVMCESGGFGTPSWEIDMKHANGNWYKAANGGGLTLLGSNVSGIFTRENVASGDRASMAIRTATGVSPIQRYAGTGVLSKTTASAPEPVYVRSFRFLSDPEGNERIVLFDYLRGAIEVVDSLQKGGILCAVRIITPDVTGTLLKQVDSLQLPLGVEVIRQGRTIAAYETSSWKTLATSSTSFQSGDLFMLRAPKGYALIRGYEEITLVGESPSQVA